MKFATRQNLGLNRPPSIWFIRRFLDVFILRPLDQ